MDFAQFLARLKDARRRLTAAQLVSLAAAFVGRRAGRRRLGLLAEHTDYALLFSDMDPEAAIDVVTKLKAQKVAYQLDDGGRTIRVPPTRVDELRLEFASDGLPSSGRIGFEIFDRTAFGATEFLEHVNYRRALEGELARTIATISEVAGARVHIAMAAARSSRQGAADQGLGGPQAAQQPPAIGRHRAGHHQPGRRPASSRCGRKRS